MGAKNIGYIDPVTHGAMCWRSHRKLIHRRTLSSRTISELDFCHLRRMLDVVCIGDAIEQRNHSRSSKWLIKEENNKSAM
jgi:hypothetical protein